MTNLRRIRTVMMIALKRALASPDGPKAKLQELPRAKRSLLLIISTNHCVSSKVLGLLLHWYRKDDMLV